MTLIEKFHFDQKVFISDRPSCLRKAKDDDDDDTNCSDSDTHSGSSDVHTVNSDAHSHLSSTDDQITFGLNLQHNEEKECILIRLATLKSQPDSVYVNFDLKFTFLNALEEEGPFSFSIKHKQVLSSSPELRKQHEVPYSQTPFGKGKLIDTYLKKSKVILKCTGHFSEIKLNMFLAELLKEREEKIMKALPKMLQNGRYSDVRLVASVSGKEFPVHRNVLAASSPVFATFFEEPANAGKRQMHIVKINTTTLELLLKFIYNDICFTDYLNRPYELLNAAIKYGLDDLKEIVMKVLSQYLNEVSPAQTRLLHELSVEHQLTELEEKALESMKRYARKEILSVIDKEESLLDVVANLKGFQTDKNDEGSIETILLKSENMQFDGFRVYLYSPRQKKYAIFGLINLYTLSFRQNHLLICGKRFVGLKRKSVVIRLDVAKLVNYNKSPSFIRSFIFKRLTYIFRDDSCVFELLLDAADKAKLLDFHSRLMDRVAVFQVLPDSEKKPQKVNLTNKIFPF